MEEVRRLRIQLRLRGGAEDKDTLLAEEAYPSTIPFFPPVTEKTVQLYTRLYAAIVAAIIAFGGIVAPVLEVKLGIGGGRSCCARAGTRDAWCWLAGMAAGWLLCWRAGCPTCTPRQTNEAHLEHPTTRRICRHSSPPSLNPSHHPPHPAHLTPSHHTPASPHLPPAAGSSYFDFINGLHLPPQMAAVDPIVASFCGGGVGVLTSLLIVEKNNAKLQVGGCWAGCVLRTLWVLWVLKGSQSCRWVKKQLLCLALDLILNAVGARVLRTLWLRMRGRRGGCHVHASAARPLCTITQNPAPPGCPITFPSPSLNTHPLPHNALANPLQEKRRCIYCEGTGYLTCGTCVGNGVAAGEACANCAGTGKVMCTSCLCTGKKLATEHDPRVDPFTLGME
jgi:hypothetical protein